MKNRYCKCKWFLPVHTVSVTISVIILFYYLSSDDIRKLSLPIVPTKTNCQWWQFFSSVLMHVDQWHLWNNVAIIFLLGIIFELIHEINLIKYIFGHITKIKTIKNSFALKKTEDHALSIFKTIKNIPGTLIQDMLSERKERYFKVLTTKNTITLDFIQNKIFILNNKSSKTIKNKYKDDQLNLIRKNIKYYIEWIKRGEFNISLFDEAVKDLKICKKMHEKF